MKALRSQRPRVVMLGITAGLLAAVSAAQAAQPMPPTALFAVMQSAAIAADPAKQVPGAVSVTAIDFKRGQDGSGRLILKFSGDGAAPDLRTQGSSVVVDVGNAKLPPSLQRPLNVTDFATPVQRVNASATSAGTQIVLDTAGPFESMAYQTGRDYIVEILPRAAAPMRAVGGTAANAVVGNAQVSATAGYRGKPVTFNFQDVPVRTVLQVIAEESNLNIVAADTVQGSMTLRLVNVPWDQALDIVLQAKGLDKRRSGSVIWVAPQSEIAKYELDQQTARINLENSVEMVTEYIPVSYANAEDVAKLLTDESKGSQGGSGTSAAGAQSSRGFLSPRGSISFDRRTNTLLVIDIPQRVASIKSLVMMLDKPVDQVVIEARVVIATETFARELGARFGIAGTKNGKYYFNNNIENNDATRDSVVENRIAGTPGFELTKGAMSNLGVLNPAGSVALQILNAGYALDVELSALQEEGRGEVISNPRIVTSNQKEALIKQGEEVGYLTLTGNTGGGQQVPQVQFKEVLLELRVTPTITNDGRVFLNMNVKKDEVIEFINTGAGQVPRIAKREVNTAILIDDGQTVAIGGVYEFKDQKDVAKVPFLGDIPFLGNLFKKRGRNKQKAELLIFVTPKVLRVAQRTM